MKTMLRGLLARSPFVAIGILLMLSVLNDARIVIAQLPRLPTPIPARQIRIGLRPYAEELKLPTSITNAGDGSGRLFVTEKAGRIRIVLNGQIHDSPFLDISSLVEGQSIERGLLGLAFHPRYKDNGLFFVHYTALNGDVVLARYHVSANPDVADPTSGQVLLTISHSAAPEHNGGQLAFGRDGYLYMGVGDGGNGDNGQDTHTLLAKILRLDVDHSEHSDPYAIPPDNPFADGKNGRPEVWAYGLRNPWRFAFDPATGDLYIGDVGEKAVEEIDVLATSSAPGANFGWNKMEGNVCFVPPDSSGKPGSPPALQTCLVQGFTLPVTTYQHYADCTAVVGGYVYRGELFPRLTGLYFFADFCEGRLWALQRGAETAWQTTQLLTAGYPISTFGVDEVGEIYLASYSGKLYQIVDLDQS